MMRKIFFLMILIFTIPVTYAVDRMPLAEIDSDKLVSDLQADPIGGGDDHMSLVWWIPYEFWAALMERDPSLGGAQKKQIMETLSKVSILAVVQADISAFGAFNFYTKDRVKKNMAISYKNQSGAKVSLSEMKDIDPDLQVLLGVFKPILAAAFGNMGNNFHFYVLNDKDRRANRIIDPYKSGHLQVDLKNSLGKDMTATIQMPVNSLFVPRKCPNGKEAHISWKFCPWSGEKLKL